MDQQTWITYAFNDLVDLNIIIIVLNNILCNRLSISNEVRVNNLKRRGENFIILGSININ